ncbi:MAG: glutamine synthetase III [Chloroflexi bacterium]|nr:glutamine synthetase III [Chloroflexota bacterium]
MAGSAARLWAINEVSNRQSRKFDWPVDDEGHTLKVADIFGCNTFNNKTMKEKLPKKVYHKLQETIKHGKNLDKSLAETVAHAVKEWALEKGATHFCHWFQPQTGLTAEKHDAFLSFDDDGQPIDRFSGSQLIQSEPDASSFPSGGMRSTFEARGYTAWDPSSPIFIMDEPNGKTLCVPSVFISYYGHALDQKAPLLRSMETLNEKALEVLKLFGNEGVVRVTPTVGPEQEYFLIDQAFYALRPDLVSAGRTLIGGKPPKGQELEDHYFGSIKDRVQAFMQEAEFELYKLGVPIKTRHNEVAPSQFETAPIFEEANIAADHNQLTMEIFRSVARLHNLTLLLHEKPFAGVNGSGKHNNWSIQDSDGNNLLEPGSTPTQNLQFLVFLTATLKAVHQRAGLLRAAIASAGNDHRLGANEAPPAIISVFLGEQLTAILDNIEANGKPAEDSTEARIIALGISKLPDVQRDHTDRNRTSPFAFTGNKFEFRAVASSASISLPMAFLNAAVADALEEIHGKITGLVSEGVEFKKAVMDVVRQTVIETKAIRFEGNNYAAEWVEEAEKRGLPNLRKSPEALAELVKPEAIKFLARVGVFSEEEVHARYHVLLERYVKDIEIEVEALKGIASTQVLPAAYQHQELLAGSIEKLQDVLKLKADVEPAKSQIAKLTLTATAIVGLQAAVEALESKVGALAEVEDVKVKARGFADNVLAAMLEVREYADRLEDIVADQLWPLPKYREMLFLS